MRGPVLFPLRANMGLGGHCPSKKLDAPTRSGPRAPRESWSKAKCRRDKRVILGGLGPEGGHRSLSLLAGAPRDGRWSTVGRNASTGPLSGQARLRSPLFARVLQKLPREDEFPFISGDNAPKKSANIRWLEPALSPKKNRSLARLARDQDDSGGGNSGFCPRTRNAKMSWRRCPSTKGLHAKDFVPPRSAKK